MRREDQQHQLSCTDGLIQAFLFVGRSMLTEQPRAHRQDALCSQSDQHVPNDLMLFIQRRPRHHDLRRGERRVERRLRLEEQAERLRCHAKHRTQPRPKIRTGEHDTAFPATDGLKGGSQLRRQFLLRPALEGTCLLQAKIGLPSLHHHRAYL